MTNVTVYGNGLSSAGSYESAEAQTTHIYVWNALNDESASQSPRSIYMRR